ncbi:MAG: hypothetical protein ABL958_19955 [Bdellovibrionia bacterium]
MNWNTLIEQFELQIRQGQGSAVKKALTDVNVSQVPEIKFSSLANIATRVGLAPLALRLLDRKIRRTGFDSSDLSIAEKSEYACALTAIGAYPEAHRILVKLQAEQYPKIFLYRAYTFFNQWRYQEAIPHLQKYLALTDLPYLRRVGEVNLCAALIYCLKYEEALKILSKLKTELIHEKQTLLLGNVLELQAQCYLGQSRFKECDRVLTDAEKLLQGTGSYFGLFAMKWKAVSALMQKSHDGVARIDEVRNQARQFSHYETLRECDYYEGIYASKNELLQNVYYGSPFESYRKKILDSVNPKLFEAIHFEKRVGLTAPGGLQDKVGWKISSDEPLPGASRNSLLHNLQRLFLSDFYSSWRVGTIYSFLCPDDHYHVESSPNRVYQLIHRWNKLAEDAKLGVRIKSDGAGFRMMYFSPGVLCVTKLAELSNRASTDLRVLRDHFGTRRFRSTDAQAILKKSQSQVSVLLKKAQDEGLKKSGSGRSTTYQFAG